LPEVQVFQAAPRRIGQEVFVIPVRLRQIQKIDASKKRRKMTRYYYYYLKVDA